MPDSVLSARGRYAAAKRHGIAPEIALAARLELKSLMLERAIREAIEAAPPLGQEQRVVLAKLLVGMP